MSIEISHSEGQEFLKGVADNSVDLILTDPPYIISQETGMNRHYQTVQQNQEKGITYVKTPEEWLHYKKTLDKPKDQLEADCGPGWSRENYLRYGTILGKKYCKETDYGDWDRDFTLAELDAFIGQYYKKLRKGGTLIIWFDIWKLSELKGLLEGHRFKQIRFIEWLKTNPQPINSKINYLTNCREVALLAVKGGKPTFHSSYDNALYQAPMAGGKDRFHPTQKNKNLFVELVQKHSNEGDLVMDTFLGGGTTALACLETKRRFIGCDANQTYIEKVKEIVARETAKGEGESKAEVEVDDEPDLPDDPEMLRQMVKGLLRTVGNLVK